MLSIEKLKEIGVNTEEALARCMGNESFYFRLIGMAAEDVNFAKLEDAIAAKDWKGSFEAAHALKGVLGNLGLTPMYNAASDLTELLRPMEPCDCEEALGRVQAGLVQLKELIG